MTERIDGLRLVLQLFGQVGKLLHFAAVHRLEQGFARGEMPVESADAHIGGASDGFEAGLRTAGTEDDFCSLQNTLAIPNGIGARFSRSFLCLPHADRPNLRRDLKSGGALRICVLATR